MRKSPACSHAATETARAAAVQRIQGRGSPHAAAAIRSATSGEMNSSSFAQRSGRGNRKGSLASITSGQAASQAPSTGRAGGHARRRAKGAARRPANSGSAKPAAHTRMLWRDSLWKTRYVRGRKGSASACSVPAPRSSPGR